MPDEWGYPSSSMPHVSSTPFSRALIGRIASLTTLWQLTDMPNNVQGVVPQPIASGSALRGAPPQALHPTVAAVPTIPTCRYPNCGRPVTKPPGRGERRSSSTPATTLKISYFCNVLVVVQLSELV